MKYCVKCGNELMDEAFLCPKCGCLVEKIGSFKTEEKEEKAEVKPASGDVENTWIGVVISSLALCSIILFYCFLFIKHISLSYFMIASYLFGVYAIIRGIKELKAKNKIMPAITIVLGGLAFLMSFIMTIIFFF